MLSFIPTDRFDSAEKRNCCPLVAGCLDSGWRWAAFFEVIFHFWCAVSDKMDNIYSFLKAGNSKFVCLRIGSCTYAWNSC